jgi:thiamine-monophosphate kinase
MIAVEEIGEDRLIEIFSAEAGSVGSKVIVANGDDAAAWFVEPSHCSVITTDCLVENVHFDLSYATPHQVGRKLIAVNLSDIAAMGATPRYVLLSVSFPGNTSVDIAKGIAGGIREQCKAHGVAILGGNTTRTLGPIHLTATLIGRAQPNELLTRRGTQVGDAIFVTGTLGNARAGLHFAQQKQRVARGDYRSRLLDALLDPEPRVKAGRQLAKASVVHAMCDVSDGLGKDLRRLLVPERLGARLDANKLPVSPQAAEYAEHAGLNRDLLALEGGEDYELVFTAAPEDEKHVQATCAAAATPVTLIGSVTTKPEIEVVMSDGTVLPVPGGFDHF